MNRAFLADLFERVIVTYIQTLLGLMTADNYNMLHLSDAKAAVIAAIPAALALVKSLVSGWLDLHSLASALPGDFLKRSFLVDLVERTGATYVQAFLGFVLADTAHLMDISSLKSASIAALPAAVAVLKGALAVFAKGDGSASLLGTPLLQRLYTRAA